MANSHCESSTRNKWGQSEKENSTPYRRAAAAPPQHRHPRGDARVPRENARDAGTRAFSRGRAAEEARERAEEPHTHTSLSSIATAKKAGNSNERFLSKSRPDRSQLHPMVLSSTSNRLRRR